MSLFILAIPRCGRALVFLLSVYLFIPRLAVAQEARPIIQLALLTNTTLTDHCHVYFQDGATQGFDSSFDATKLPNPSGLNISTFGGSQQMAINGLPPLVPGSASSVAIFVGVPAYGTYRFRVNQFDNFFATRVYLRDHSLNTRTQLALNTTYSFSMNGTYSTSTRFELEFEEPLLPDLLVTTAMPVPAASYRNITIATGGQLTFDKNVTVTGTLTIQRGGMLSTGLGTAADPDGYVLSGNRFVMEPGSRINILSRQGISAQGASGSIRTFSRRFINDATYTYTCVLANTSVAPVTGSGLPDTVRTLGAAVYLPNAAPGTLTLSKSLAVSRLLDLITNLNTGGHSLTLQSTATGISAQVGLNPGTLTGLLTMERAINPGLNGGAGYRHFSNPLQGNTTQVFITTTGQVPVSNPAYNNSAEPGTVQPFPTMFSYDPTAIAGSPALGYSPFDRGWRNLGNGDAAPGRGRGFIVHLDAGQVAQFQGTLSNATQALSLPARSTPDDGWQLLGNPFASLLDWSQVPVPAGMESAFYVFESTGAYAGRYRSYVNGIGTSALIPTCQAFFVRTRAGSTPVSFALPASARTVSFDASVPTLYRGTADPRAQIKLSLRGNGSADELYVYAEAGATPAYDAQFDARKLASPGQVELAALAGSDRLSISGLPPFTPAQATLVPLQVAVPRPGSYTFEAPLLSNLSGVDVFLLDSYTGQRISLRQQASYSFTAAAGSLTGRFSLQIGASQVTASSPASLAAGISLYPNPTRENLQVTVPPVSGNPAIEAELLDNLGRTILQQHAAGTAAGSSFSLPTATLAPGVYTLRLRIANAVITRRVVVE